MVRVVMWAMGRDREWQMKLPLPATHLLLGGLVPNRPQTNTGWYPRVRGMEHQGGTPSRVGELNFQSPPHSSPGFQQALSSHLGRERTEANGPRSVVRPFIQWVFTGPTLHRDCPRH